MPTGRAWPSRWTWGTGSPSCTPRGRPGPPGAWPAGSWRTGGPGRGPAGPAPVPQGALTGTEAAVIEGLAQGLTDESVARRVGVTPRTVRRHVAAVSERYGATSRLQLGLLLGRVPERRPVPDGRAEPGGAAGGPSPVGAAVPHPAQG
ncbi:helix-turn-helix transcriptional regulator [Streptomyces sp. NPDC058701]|uniref:helix-turn-helix transcriptional regulator n=1 Tax=Streptomyces sp. NPDC058701 TaxID=3346608 RepID=UPI00365668D5